ncbi:flagellar hook protein FlgE [Ciceribacter sp. L1K23]|uniref:flagellar hook protein FlgE n=1 Tax=unclassified Ciceribacter TaxID=2628820 RepID=UPI001ABE0129|nr:MULTISPECIES: flagellar hook protein FlgE [unclassified Ciceribacter]MBO3758352.1 flagellar hook protein FlgE [Ciceribacter sp. L1K22]MBR0556988.1 flagellar hook protein FlgE [Ciceribacter sp. L1K23]
MSLYGTMRTGVSGMNAQANRLGTVGENIANSSTVGYKRADIQFSSMILPSTAGAYNSGGVNSVVRYNISDQGTFSYTTSKTDLAINGSGFFIVTGADGTNYMTRAGSFVPMDDGTLQNAAGYTLMGYQYSSTEDPTIVVNGFDGLEPINLASAAIEAKASETGTLLVNVPSSAAIGDTKTTSVVAIDSQGNTRLLTFTYEKTAVNEWEVSASYDDNGTPVSALAATTLTFDVDGQLVVPPSPTSLTTTLLDDTILDGAELPPITLDITGTTQLNADWSVKANIDGNEAATVKGYEVSADGVVSVLYTNGKLVPRYRVALATVQSPDNLNPVAGNLYTQSNTSGVVVLGYAQNSGFGSVLSGALEDSNVDIAEELTAMIEAQRSYTANSKVFQTGSELLEVLVNLKR